MFFCLKNPPSNAKPACIINTRKAPKSVQLKLTAYFNPVTESDSPYVAIPVGSAASTFPKVNANTPIIINNNHKPVFILLETSFILLSLSFPINTTFYAN